MPVTGHTLRGSIKPWLCIGSSREDLLQFSLPNSEMHFSTLSVSASTLRTRLAVIGMPTLFFIVLLYVLYHGLEILSREFFEIFQSRDMDSALWALRVQRVHKVQRVQRVLYRLTAMSL